MSESQVNILFIIYDVYEKGAMNFVTVKGCKTID